MGEIVNLRRFKKAKARDDAAKQAGEHRAQFGRTKPEKNKSAAVKALEARKLDAHKRDE
jgi:hypothetical protein